MTLARQHARIRASNVTLEHRSRILTHCDATKVDIMESRSSNCNVIGVEKRFTGERASTFFRGNGKGENGRLLTSLEFLHTIHIPSDIVSLLSSTTE